MPVRYMGVARRLALVLGVLPQVVCALDVPWVDGADPAASGEQAVAPPPPRVLTVRIANNTDLPLDPQLYVAPAEHGAAALFEANHKRTDFGVGMIGVLTAATSGEFQLECGAQVLIGTAGGAFGDNLSVPVGTGAPVILQEGLSLRCGDILTLTFARSGDQLVSSYTVVPG